MKTNLKEFFDSTPTPVDIAIAICLMAVGLGFGLAMGRSSELQLNKEGIKIGQKAIANQKDLEWAFTIIQIQDGLITRQEQEVRDFSRRYKAGEELLETASFAADVIPDKEIDELGERVEESKILFDEALPN